MAGGLSGPFARLAGELSVGLCGRVLWRWTAGRGDRLAQLCAAPHAAALWPAMGHPALGCVVDLLASAGLFEAGSSGRPGTGLATFLTNFSEFLLLVLAIAIILTWVFNHTRGSIFISGACQRQYPTGRFGAALSCRRRDQPEPGRPHRLWGAGAADCHSDTRSAWLPAGPTTIREARGAWRNPVFDHFGHVAQLQCTSGPAVGSRPTPLYNIKLWPMEQGFTSTPVRSRHRRSCKLSRIKPITKHDENGSHAEVRRRRVRNLQVNTHWRQARLAKSRTCSLLDHLRLSAFICASVPSSVHSA